MGRIIKCVTNIMFCIVILVLVGYYALRITNKVEIYNVKTGSMESKIHVGDYILIFRKNDYNVGDVVTYTSDNGFITHRIIKKEGNIVTTKGDANNTEDEKINESVILGKVILSGGLLNIIIDYKYAFVGCLLALYLFSCYISDDKDLLSQDNEENERNIELNKDSLIYKEKVEDNIENKNSFNEKNIDIKESNIFETKDLVEKTPVKKKSSTNNNGKKNNSTKRNNSKNKK